MQLHYGCKRDNNTTMYNKLGADTGYDCISNFAPADQLTNMLVRSMKMVDCQKQFFTA